MELDDRGIPTEVDRSNTSAPHCPPQACQLCYGVSNVNQTPAEQIAMAFHESYERQASDHKYETRKESAVSWYKVPDKNRSLMIAVVRDLLKKGIIISELSSRYLTSWEWCQDMDTCAATVDWDKIAENRMDH